MWAEVVSCLVSLFTRAVGREGHCRQISLACVESTHSVPATLGLTPLTECVLSRLHCSGSRLLYREWALSCVYFPGLSCSGSGFRVLHKYTDLIGPAFCAFPGPSSSGSQELDECTLPGCSAPYSLHDPSLSFQEPVRCALCLFWGAGL